MADKRRASPGTTMSLKAHAFSVEALIGAEKQQPPAPPPRQPKRRKVGGEDEAADDEGGSGCCAESPAATSGRNGGDMEPGCARGPAGECRLGAGSGGEGEELVTSACGMRAAIGTSLYNADVTRAEGRAKRARTKPARRSARRCPGPSASSPLRSLRRRRGGFRGGVPARLARRRLPEGLRARLASARAPGTARGAAGRRALEALPRDRHRDDHHQGGQVTAPGQPSGPGRAEASPRVGLRRGNGCTGQGDGPGCRRSGFPARWGEV